MCFQTDCWVLCGLGGERRTGFPPLGQGQQTQVSISVNSCCEHEIYLYNNVYILLYIPPLGNVFPAKVNDSIIIRNSTSPEAKVCLKFSAKMVNPGTFRTAFNAVRKNSENMSSRTYNFSNMQNIRM